MFVVRQKKRRVAITLVLRADTTLSLDTVKRRVMDLLCVDGVRGPFVAKNFAYDSIGFVSAADETAQGK